MNCVQMLIKVTPEIQIQIEEYCLNAGVNISDYFQRLHLDNMQLKDELENPEKYMDNTVSDDFSGKVPVKNFHDIKVEIDQPLKKLKSKK